MQAKVKAILAALLLIAVVGCGGTGITPDLTAPSSDTPAGSPPAVNDVLVLEPGVKYAQPPAEFEDPQFNMATPPRGVTLAELQAKGFSDPNNILQLGSKRVSMAQVWTEYERLSKMTPEEVVGEQRATRSASKVTSAVQDFELDLNAPYQQGTIGGEYEYKMYGIPIEQMKAMAYRLAANGGEAYLGWSNYSRGRWEWESVSTDGLPGRIELNSEAMEEAGANDKPWSPYDNSGQGSTAWVVVVTKGTQPLSLVAEVTNASGASYFSPNPWLPRHTAIGLERDKTTSSLNEDQDVLLEFEPQVDPFDIPGSDARHIFTRTLSGGGNVFLKDVPSIEGHLSDDDDLPVTVVGAIPGGTYIYSSNVQAFDGGIGGESAYEPIQIPFLTRGMDADASNPGQSIIQWPPVLGAAVTEYKIFRNEEGEPIDTVTVEDPEPAVYEYVDEDPPMGQINAYYIRAVNQFDDSEPSNTVYLPNYLWHKVTGLGTATIGDYTALAYDGDIPVLVYSETQEVEGLTSVTIRCLVANAAGPSELADFTASEVVDLGDTSIHGLAVEVNSSQRIVIVYSTDEGVSAAVSLTGTEDPPTDSSGWDVSAIDSDPLAGHQLNLVLVDDKPAVAYARDDWIVYAYSNLSQPSEEADWLGKYDIVRASEPTAITGLDLTFVAGKPAIGVSTTDFNLAAFVVYANVSEPEDKLDWSTMHIIRDTPEGRAIGLRGSGTTLQAIVVGPAIDVRMGSADVADLTEWSTLEKISNTLTGVSRVLTDTHNDNLAVGMQTVNGSPLVCLALTGNPEGPDDWVQTPPLGPSLHTPGVFGFDASTSYMGLSLVDPGGNLILRWTECAP